MAKAKRERATSDIVLNFYIDFADSVDVWNQRDSIDDSRAEEFLSVGISEVSTALGMSLSSWDIHFSTPGSSNSRAEEGPLDLRYEATLHSPVSAELTWDSTSELGRAAIACDARFSKKRSYVLDLFVVVEAILRQERPHRVDFNVAVSTETKGKSAFATNKHYEFISGTKRRKVLAWRDALGKRVLDAYKKYLHANGLYAGSGQGEIQ